MIGADDGGRGRRAERLVFGCGGVVVVVVTAGAPFAMPTRHATVAPASIDRSGPASRPFTQVQLG